MENKMITIRVVVEGGVVQGVVAHTPFNDPVKVVVVDYDTDGVDDEDLTDDGQGDKAVISEHLFNI